METEEDSKTCSICLDQDESVEEIVFKSCDCVNTTHEECMNNWITKSNGKCPICRKWASVEMTSIIFDRDVFPYIYHQFTQEMMTWSWNLRLFFLFAVSWCFFLTLSVSFSNPFRAITMAFIGIFMVLSLFGWQVPIEYKKTKYYLYFFWFSLFCVMLVRVRAFYIGKEFSFTEAFIMLRIIVNMPNALLFMFPKKYKILKK